MRGDRKASDRISDLRKACGDTQVAFARRLEVTQPMVSAWEGGRDVPSLGAYLRLANLASFPDKIWFWKQAGIEEDTMLSTAVEHLKKVVEDLPRGKILPVPALESQRGGKQESLWYADARYVPIDSRPAYYAIPEGGTEGIHVPWETIILLDTSANDAKTLEPFWNSLVLIEVTEEDRRGFQFPPRCGLHMGWLHLATGEAEVVRYAVRDPSRESTHNWTPYSPSEAKAFGRWTSGNPSDDLQKKYFASEGRMTEWDLWDAGARKELQLFRGCTILGRVLGWFVPAQELGK